MTATKLNEREIANADHKDPIGDWVADRVKDGLDFLDGFGEGLQGTGMPLAVGGGAMLSKTARAANVGLEAIQSTTVREVKTVGELRKAGLKDAHHNIQDAAMRDIPGYKSNEAPGVQLAGPANKPGTPHYKATQAQRVNKGGTYGVERVIGYKALRAAGLSSEEARAEIQAADRHFATLGVTADTVTRMPLNRKRE